MLTALIGILLLFSAELDCAELKGYNRYMESYLTKPLPEEEKDIYYILQEGLYKQYQYGLPDEPRRMARYVMHVLNSNGYVVAKNDR